MAVSFTFHLIFNWLHCWLGGDGGIRTLDRALQPYNGLANRRLQPLGHVSRSSARRAYARRIPPMQALAGQACVVSAKRLEPRRTRKPRAWQERACATLPTVSTPSSVVQAMRETKDCFHPFRRRLMIETPRVFATARSVSYQASPSRGRRAYRAKASRFTPHTARHAVAWSNTSVPLRTRNTNRLIRRGRTADGRT